MASNFSSVHHPLFRENATYPVVYPACWGGQLSVLRGVLLALFAYSLVPPCVPWGPPLSQAVCQGKAMRKCCASIFFSSLPSSGVWLWFHCDGFIWTSPPGARGICPGTQGWGVAAAQFQTRPYNTQILHTTQTNLTNSQPCLC